MQLLQELVNSKRLTLSENRQRGAESGRRHRYPARSVGQQAAGRQPPAESAADRRHLREQHPVPAEYSGQNWLDRGLQAERNLKEQIQVLKGSPVLSRILYQQQQSLPQGTLLADMDTRIADPGWRSSISISSATICSRARITSIICGREQGKGRAGGDRRAERDRGHAPRTAGSAE